MAYIIIDLIIGFLFLLVAFVASVNGGYKVKLNRTYVYFTLATLVWLITNQISNDTTFSIETATKAGYLLFLSSYLSAFFLLELTSAISGNIKANQLLQTARPLLWVGAVISSTPFVAKGVVAQGSVYAIQFGPLIVVYGVLVAAMVVAILSIVTNSLRHADKKHLCAMRPIGYGLLLTVAPVLTMGFIIPYITNNFFITQFSLVPSIFLVIGLYISVAKHGLFDVKQAVVRTAAYTVSLIVLATIYFTLAYLVSIVFFRDNQTLRATTSPVNIVLALVLAFLFQPIIRFFDKVTDKIFFRDQYDTNSFIEKLGSIHTSTSSINTLLHLTAKEITNTLKAVGCVFIVRDQSVYSGVIGASNKSLNTRPLIADIEALNKLHLTPNVAQMDDLNRFHHLPKKISSLLQGEVVIILPLSHDNEVIGYLLLGDHQTGGYASRDLQTLNVIADEIIIAIQNSLSFQAVRDLNDSLQQKIKDATAELQASNQRLLKLDETKDEFMSIASHQLRTPLTSIKGYISMLLEGDLGKVAPAQKKVLEEAFQSSERMVSLIGDFLNVSRLQTGKFSIDREKCQIDEIIDSEVKNLEAVASTRGLKLKLITTRKRLPILYIDEQKIRQTVMNFIDNAIYYSKPGKTITVKLQVIDGSVEFRVIDSGIGVPKEEQAQLFTKFFRATNAHKRRPDGTGVGLFLAKKVIDGHGGSIIFQSEEGKGSTFGFLLPIKKLSEPPEPEEA